MSDTPRTDDFIKSVQENHRLNAVDDFNHYFKMTGSLSDFARQLERENQQLQLRVEQAESSCKEWAVSYELNQAHHAQEIELLSKQITEKDEALRFYADYHTHAERINDGGSIARQALSTTGSDYIHKDELSQFKEKCRGIAQKLKLIEHATNDAFGSGQGAYHENALQAAREALDIAKELGLT